MTKGRFEGFIERYGILFLFMFYSAALLTFCSMCSFLFPLHDRVDQNVFFTIGREMLKGKVVYRDMFEHKGPLTYFIHAFAALISSSSFIGVYFIEIIALTAFLYFAYRTALLFTGKTASVVCSLVCGALILTSGCFLRGDNVEELCFPFLMVPTYYMLRTYKLPENPEPRRQTFAVTFLFGIMFGIVLWIKFTLVGFFIGWAFVFFIPMLLHKEFKLFWLHVLAFVSAFVLTAVPWIIYFACNGALYDFIYTYFYCNLFLYGTNIPFGMHVVSIFMGLEQNILNYLVLFVISVYGLIRLCKIHVFSPLITYASLYAGVFFNGRWYDYYYLILAFYVLFGIIYIWCDICTLMRFVKSRLGRFFKKNIPAYPRIFIMLSVLICIAYSALCSNCTRFYFAKSKDYPQNIFAEYIESSGIENPTLLNYGFIDQGFYFAAGISPINKYFCRVNIAYSALPEMYNEQKEIIDNKRVDFVVVRMYGANRSVQKDYIGSITSPVKLSYQNPSYSVPKDKVPMLFENYELVMQANDISAEYTFGLFMKK